MTVKLVKDIWVSLNVGRFASVFAGSQVIVITCAFLRIPLVAGSSSTSVLGSWLFWVTLLGWASVLSSAATNLSRVHGIDHGGLIPPLRFEVAIRRTLIFLLPITFLLSTMLDNEIWGGAAPTIAYFYVVVTNARHVGFVYSQNKADRQFWAMALGSIAGLVGTFAVTKLSLWANVDSKMQVGILVTISVLAASAPSFAARLHCRLQGVAQSGPAPMEHQGFALETASLLPPAFMSGFDAGSHLMTGNKDALPLYGVTSRLSLAVSFLPGALYIQVNNLLQRQATSRVGWQKVSVALLALNIPFVIIFLTSYGMLVRALSQNKISAQWGCAFAVAAIGLILPVWTAISGAISGNSDARKIMGKRVLWLILPLSLLSTVVLSALFGAVGPLIGTGVAYFTASILGHRVLATTHLTSNSTSDDRTDAQ
jgi:hypothetical protein